MKAFVRAVAVLCGVSLVACGPGGTFVARLENVAPFKYLVATAMPGGALGSTAFSELTFTAGKNHRVTFVAMLGESNDWFFAPVAGGIPLYENGVAVTGDVTSYIRLWDAGTEVNEEPAVGAHTGPRQSSSTDGPGAVDSNRNVRALGQTETLADASTFTLPAIDAMIRVTISQTAVAGRYVLRIQNVSTSTTLNTTGGARAITISRPVVVVHSGDNALFTEGQVDRGEGLEELAESGSVTKLAAATSSVAGVATGISPGLFAVHTEGKPLYTTGAQDSGEGLEQLAEQGDPSALLTAVAKKSIVKKSGVFNTPVGGSLGPATPGNAFEWEFGAGGTERLSLAAMFGASNDWIFATPAEGIAMFDAQGEPLEGDRTSELKIIDVGTELNEDLASGENTGPNQATPESGLVDSDRNVRDIGAAHGKPASTYLKLTITRK